MPSLGMLTINALAAADSVVIPTQPHYLSAKGLELLLRDGYMKKPYNKYKRIFLFRKNVPYYQNARWRWKAWNRQQKLTWQ